MKKVTASEARKDWFRLLDEAAGGEVVVIERNGKRLVLRREELSQKRMKNQIPNYRKLLRVSKPEHADQWHWDWSEAAQGLRLVTHPKK